MKHMKEVVKDDSGIVNIIETSIDTIHKNTLYTPPIGEGGSDIRGIITNSITNKSEQDRKTVKENLNNQMAFQDAVAPFLEEENFDLWYADLKQQLEHLAK